MASYHSHFKYNDKDSYNDMGLIIAAFEPDNGFKDTFLSMDPVYEESAYGTKRYDYGAKYNSVATIEITMVKPNGSNISLTEFRAIARWLTGMRINSWLELYSDKEEPDYYFLGRMTDLKHYKLDGRTVGIQAIFTSVAPWAFSAEQHFSTSWGQKLYVDENGVLNTGAEVDQMSIKDGVLYAGSAEAKSSFRFLNNNIIYIDNSAFIQIDNQTDDMYSYINLDTKFINNDCTYLKITNLTLGEDTIIQSMKNNEVIYLSAEQFIVSDDKTKIFGDDFNFIWPRVAPGLNQLAVTGGGHATLEMTYRYPMKVGDCVIDIYSEGTGCICDGTPGGEFGTVAWDDIVGTPDTIGGYGIKDAYTIKEVDYKIENVTINEDELNDILTDAFG